MNLEKRKIVSRPTREFYCRICQRNTTEYANADGLAEELADIALYLCDRCVQKEQKRVDIGRIGEYRILQELGRGGMGIVYKAWHEPTRRLVALKKILPESAVDERAKKLFQREMTIMEKLVHRNIVRLIDHGSRGNEFYFISEYLPGGNMFSYVSDAQRSHAPVSEVLRIFCQILEGLDYAHKKGFIHRDVKPHNMLLTEDGNGKLSDFGLSKNLNETGMTRTGEVAGTYLFMAPEQIIDYRNVKPSSDVYSVGVSLYYVLTGKHPYGLLGEERGIRRILKKEKPRGPIAMILEKDRVPIR